MNEAILQALSITKHFGSVKALTDVSITVRRGSVHALLGENGAGKSTLVKCIMGYYHPDAGQLLYKNKEQRFGSPQQAVELGIGMVYQHFTLVNNMTVAENFVLARPKLPKVIQWQKEIQALEKQMSDMPFKIDLNKNVSELSVGEKQKVEITKQLLLNTSLLILDEPTSVLTPVEADEVLSQIHRLTRDKGLSVLMITHKFREVMSFADDVTVLRKGQFAGSIKVADASTEALADMMIGGESLVGAPESQMMVEGDVKLDIRNLVVRDDQGVLALDDLDLQVRGGEIIGIAGVSGNGQKQLVEALAGQRSIEAGDIFVQGEKYDARQSSMLKHQFYCLPEEPLPNACVGAMSVADNIVMRRFNQPQFTWLKVFINRRAISNYARQMIKRYGIRTSGPDQPIRDLSGGNIQRAVLARELANPVTVLVVSNPVFGLDFKAVADIHAQIVTARNNGAAVLLLSEDLDEIIELSDQFYVISEGKLVYKTFSNDVDILRVGQYMAGH